jgi:NAD(P) transhydrogenase subunit alpha
VAVTPETAKKLKAQGHTVRIVQSGAGVAASVTDAAYEAAGARSPTRPARSAASWC